MWREAFRWCRNPRRAARWRRETAVLSVVWAPWPSLAATACRTFFRADLSVEMAIRFRDPLFTDSRCLFMAERCRPFTSFAFLVSAGFASAFSSSAMATNR